MNLAAKERLWSDFRVGVITFIGLTFLVMGITFAGGDKGLLFKKTSIVKARLVDVGGLKKGSSVTMNGMVIGKVTDIGFVHAAQAAPEGPVNQIEVTMEVRSDLRPKIKRDAVPAVRTQGMLGDRYIDIPAGSESAAPLAEGEILIGETAGDFDKSLKQAAEVMNETQTLLKAINKEEGTMGKFVYDEKFYENLTAVTDQLRDLIQDFKKNPRRYIKFSVF